MTDKTVLVAGAGGALGMEIVRALRANNVDVIATYRTERSQRLEQLGRLGARVEKLDIQNHEHTAAWLETVDAAVFTPILSVSAGAARHLRPDQPAVFFSSNNVAIDPEAPIYAALRQAEDTVRKAAPLATILRPTMIYGYPGDGNLSRLMAAMRRNPIVFSPGRGSALQQPVYFKALASIVVDRLFASGDASRIFSVAGPEAVSQKALFQQAASAAGAGPMIVSVPAAPFAAVARLIEKIGLKPPLSSAQLARVDTDKTPRDASPILTDISLQEGLTALASAMDDALDDGPTGA